MSALRSIRVQLPLVMLMIAGALLLTSLSLALRRATDATRATREGVLRGHVGSVARLLSEYLQHGTVDEVRTAVSQFAGTADLCGAVVVDADDRVIATTRSDWDGQPLDATAFARARALAARVRHEDRPDDETFPDEHFVIVIPVFDVPAEVQGGLGRQHLLLAEFDLHPLLARARGEILSFYGISVLFALLGLLLMALFLQHRVARPAIRLAEAAERIAGGDRTARVGLKGADELARAGQAFDRMAARIEDAEAALRRHQVMLDGLLLALPVGVLAIARDDQRVLFSNSRWREISNFDLRPGHRLGDALEALRFYRRDGTALTPDELAVPQVLRTGEPVGATEVVIEARDGTRIPIVVRAVPVRFGEGRDFDAVVAVMQDRRDFERLFEELQRSERRFEALLEALPVGVLMVDRASRTVLYANHRLNELCGVVSPMGHPISRLVGRRETDDGRVYPIERMPLERALAEGRPVEVGDLVFVHDDGSRVPVVTVAEPMNLRGGPEFDAVVAVLQDRRDLERAVQELRLSESRFAAVVESLPVGVLLVDRASLRVLAVNPRVQELMGHRVEPGMTLDDVIRPVEHADGTPFEHGEHTLRRVLATGAPAEGTDMVLVQPGGARVPVVAISKPVNLAGGPEFDAVLGMLQDRRDLARAFEELHRSEARLTALLESLPVGVFMVDRATRTVLYANQRLDDLCGVPTPVGMPIHQLTGRKETERGEEYPRDRLPIERALEEHRAVEVDDLVYVRPDGTRVPAVTYAFPARISGGPEFDAVVAVIQDRRDLERAFAEVREWEERFQAVAHATGVAVYEWDLSRDHCRFSDSLTSVFGYAADEVDSNEKWNRITHPDDLPAVHDELLASERERRMFDSIYRLRHRDGRWRWVRDRALLRFDETGSRLIGLMGAVADITEQRELESRLHQAQKMETVGTLAGGIAHDFNNQLTGVLGHLDLLGDELPGADARQEHVRIARAAAERCAELTRGMLAFSRMLRSEPRPVDVNATLAETAALLRRVLPATIRLDLVPAAELPAAMVDPTQLQQVLLNLCVNARDAMPDGGHLRLATERASVGPEAAAAAGVAPGEYVRIVVADDGAGIAPEVLPRIFEPFFTTKPVGGGTGLGLSMVYGIVSQHLGWVDVQSEPGRGAAFRVHLPAAPASAAVAEDAPAAAPAAAPTYAARVVLVVDDEPIVREFAVRLLERAGCRVLQAANGDEALARLGEPDHRVESVLLDLTMPGPPARDVVRAIRRLAPAARIVLTSGYAQEVISAPEFAGLGFLPKPFTPAQLAEAMCGPPAAGDPPRA